MGPTVSRALKGECQVYTELGKLCAAGDKSTEEVAAFALAHGDAFAAVRGGPLEWEGEH